MRAVISRRLANPGWDALAARSGIRRGFSGKVLGEEERAAENIYIKVRFHFLCSCRFRFLIVFSAGFEECWIVGGSLCLTGYISRELAQLLYPAEIYLLK